MKPIELREADFKREVEAHNYPQSMKDEFFSYWSEPNKSGTKMRFELEKTWHLGRRLARWANNNFGKGETKTAVKQLPVMKQKQAETEIEKLDQLLERYRQHPTTVPFTEFGNWYDFMKANRLLRTFTRGEVDRLQEAYGADKGKCRCAAVQMTFDDYGLKGWNFSNTMEARARLA